MTLFTAGTAVEDMPKRDPQQNPSKKGVTFEQVCALAAKLPGIERGTSYGTPALRVKGKFLLRLKEDGETVAIKVPMDERDLLLKAEPEIFFLTDHYRNYPAVLFRLGVITPDQLVDLLDLAWSFVAPKRLVARADRSQRGRSR